jgi:hypothetical protein
MSDDVLEQAFDAVDFVEAVDSVEPEQPVAIEPEPEQSPEPEPVQIAEVIDTPSQAIAVCAPAIDEDTFFRNLDLLSKMAQCDREKQEAFNRWQEMKEDAKSAKKQYESCLLDLQEIASEIADVMAGVKTIAMPTTKAITGPGQDASVAAAIDSEDIAWRLIRTADGLQGIKGLGKKKLEQLCDVAPTIGQLEDLRGSSGGDFKTALPHGFGEKVASEIEDRLWDLQKPKTIPAHEQVKLNKPVEELQPAQVVCQVSTSYVCCAHFGRPWFLFSDRDSWGRQLRNSHISL